MDVYKLKHRESYPLPYWAVFKNVEVDSLVEVLEWLEKDYTKSEWDCIPPIYDGEGLITFRFKTEDLRNWFIMRWA